ncbi:4427_t:CDS:2, partial [Racocetra fulgida]
MATQKIKNLVVPPYIDKYGSQSVTDSQWIAALNIWTSSLSLILKSNDTDFANYLFHNESLQKFLESFLGIRAKIRRFEIMQNRHSMEVDLDKKVLAILLRLSEPSISSIQMKNGITLGEALYQNNLISVPFLLDVVAMYGRSNTKQIEKFIDNTIKSVTKIIQDFEMHSSDKFQEIADSEKTSKSVMIDKKKLANARTYLEYMLDISITLDCLFIVSKSVANIFNDRQDFEDNVDFLMTIENFYDNIIPIISKIFESDKKFSDISRDLIILKHALVSLTFHTLNACYFSPVGFTSNEGDVYSFVKSDDKLEDIENINSKIERMGDVLLFFIESSQLDKPVESFVDAPLLLDIEIEFDLSGKLIRIKNEVLNGYPFFKKKTHLMDLLQDSVDYIVGSLELLRNMNQESDKLPWQIRLEEKQKKHFARSITHKSDTIDTIDTIEDSDMKRIALISQVQDLFPDLGEGFIEECLTAFDDNVEMIINRLLENSLPAHLNELDRSMARAWKGKWQKIIYVKRFYRRRTFTRDDFTHLQDEFDNLVITHESELIKAFQSDQSVFERTSAVRRSDKRARLKNITGMADEQLEGWYIMFQRNFRDNREEASSSDLSRSKTDSSDFSRSKTNSDFSRSKTNS